MTFPLPGGGCGRRLRRRGQFSEKGPVFRIARRPVTRVAESGEVDEARYTSGMLVPYRRQLTPGHEMPDQNRLVDYEGVEHL
jgi:hypothetical protein